jgi:hypothetical protein
VERIVRATAGGDVLAQPVQPDTRAFQIARIAEMQSGGVMPRVGDDEVADQRARIGRVTRHLLDALRLAGDVDVRADGRRIRRPLHGGLENVGGLRIEAHFDQRLPDHAGVRAPCAHVVRAERTDTSLGLTSRLSIFDR